jgi:hypothetical protein
MVLLMTKFDKSEKIGLFDLLFWNIRFRQFSEKIGLFDLLFWNIRFQQFQSKAKEDAKFKDLKI